MQRRAGAAPDSRLLLVPGSGHGVYPDQPQALIAAMRTFLAGEWPAGAESIGR